MMFSFVIPVFNTEKYLRRCLDSILAQTDGDFEVIVVDDCSPGNCAEIASRYGASVKYVRHEKNRSAFQARNTGVKMASGAYIVPVDPDDYLLPEVLERARRAIDAEHPDVVVYRMEYDTGRRIRPHWFSHPAGSASAQEVMHELAEGRMLTGIACKMIRRDVFLSALSRLSVPPDAYLNTSDDYLVLMAVLMLASRVSFLDYVGYRYCMVGGSTSHSWDSVAGLKDACLQTRLANDLVRALCDGIGLPSRAANDVHAVIRNMERWFAHMAITGSDGDLSDKVDVLTSCFGFESVCKEAVSELVAVRRSRAYALGSWLLSPLRLLRRLIGGEG